MVYHYLLQSKTAIYPYKTSIIQRNRFKYCHFKVSCIMGNQYTKKYYTTCLTLALNVRSYKDGINLHAEGG